MRTDSTVTTTVTYFPARLGAFRRFPRFVKETFTMTVDIASVTGAEAPVAAAFPQVCQVDSIGFPEEGLRFFEGSLYARDGSNAAESSQFPLHQTDCVGDGNREAVEEVIRAKYAKLLIVDGHVWAKVGEPSYWIEVTPSETKLRIVLFRTAGKTGARDFSVHEPEAAVREAMKIAAGTGDGESVAAITKGFQPLEVVIPEAFTFETQAVRVAGLRAELRIMADEATALLAGEFHRGQLGEAQKKLTKLRDEMIGSDLQAVGA